MKLNITFKNVGQGDTIFLDWENGGNKKFALIDCNLVDGDIHPIIEHIESENDRNGIKEFEFMVMSHPHSDHFSGFPSLFDYCQKKAIKINTFYHTAAFDPLWLKRLFKRDIKKEFNQIVTSSVNRRVHKKLLQKLYRQLDEQNKISPNGFIEEVFTIDIDYPIQLNDEIDLVFRSPYQRREIEKYITSTFEVDAKEQFREKKMENNPQANYLSSLIQISHRAGWQVLLCSDVTGETLNKILDNPRDLRKITQKKLLAAQIPHHGSIHNHVESFWQQFTDLEKTDIIISVGERYKHPNVKVVNFFKEKCKTIHATNFVGGYREAFSPAPLSEEERRRNALNESPVNRQKKQSKAKNSKANHPNCCEKRLSIDIDENGHASCEVIDCTG